VRTAATLGERQCRSLEVPLRAVSSMAAIMTRLQIMMLSEILEHHFVPAYDSATLTLKTQPYDRTYRTRNPEFLNDRAPLAEALTIPAPWYVDNRKSPPPSAKTVFRRTWQIVGRADQVRKARRLPHRQTSR